MACSGGSLSLRICRRKKMFNYQQAKSEKQENDEGGDDKTCRRREAKRDAERIDKIKRTSAEHKKQVKREQVEN